MNDNFHYSMGGGLCWAAVAALLLHVASAVRLLGGIRSWGCCSRPPSDSGRKGRFLACTSFVPPPPSLPAGRSLPHRWWDATYYLLSELGARACWRRQRARAGRGTVCVRRAGDHGSEGWSAAGWWANARAGGKEPLHEAFGGSALKHRTQDLCIHPLYSLSVSLAECCRRRPETATISATAFSARPQ